MIEPTSIVYERCHIAESATIGHYCIIGAPPEKKGVWPDSPFGVSIGEGSVLHGLNTIDAGAKRPTTIGRNVWLMKAVHVGHCAQIADNVVIAPHTSIGGGVTIGEGCNLGMGAMVHPNVSIPPYCMIGCGAVITKGLEMHPFGIYAGNPAKFIKRNDVGIEKHGLTPGKMAEILKTWNNGKHI